MRLGASLGTHVGGGESRRWCSWRLSGLHPLPYLSASFFTPHCYNQPPPISVLAPLPSRPGGGAQLGTIVDRVRAYARIRGPTTGAVRKYLSWKYLR